MILLALVLRMAVAFAYGVHQNASESPTFGDTAEYWGIAANLANTGGMYAVLGDRVCQASRPPLYPIVLAAAINVAKADAVRVAVILQALMGTLTCWLVYRIAREKFGERAGRIAFILCAIYPFFIFYTGLFLTETLFCLLYVLLNWLMTKASGRSAPLWAAGCGVALGLCALTRSELLAFPLVALPIWILTGENRLRRLGHALIATLVMAAVVSPWAIRNSEVFHGKTVIGTTRLGHDLYEANNPQADGGIAAERIAWDKAGFVPNDADMSDEQYEFAKNRALRAEAIAWIKENPGRFLALVPQKIWRTWRPIPAFSEFQNWYFVAVSLASYVPVMLLAAAGAWLLRKRARKDLWPLLAPVIFVALAHCVFIGSLRYNLPAMPFVIILAAVSLDRIAAGYLARRARRRAI